MSSEPSDVPGSAELGTTLAAGELFACGYEGVLSLCWVGLMGALWARSESIAQPRTDMGLFVASGARGAVTLPLSPSLALVGQAEILLPFVRAIAAVDGEEVWRVPSFSGAGAAGLQVNFL